MNRYARILASLTLVGATAACAPAADEPTPSADASAMTTTEPMGSMSMAPMLSSGTPSPMASHDMGTHDMGDMGGESREPVTVDIANFAFVPTRITISAGTEVVFTNSDAAPHTATAGTDAQPTPEVFDSGLLQPGGTFSFVFEEPGEYAYFCERHPPMTGTIVVEG